MSINTNPAPASCRDLVLDTSSTSTHTNTPCRSTSASSTTSVSSSSSADSLFSRSSSTSSISTCYEPATSSPTKIPSTALQDIPPLPPPNRARINSLDASASQHFQDLRVRNYHSQRHRRFLSTSSLTDLLDNGPKARVSLKRHRLKSASSFCGSVVPAVPNRQNVNTTVAPAGSNQTRTKRPSQGHHSTQDSLENNHKHYDIGQQRAPSTIKQAAFSSFAFPASSSSFSPQESAKTTTQHPASAKASSDKESGPSSTPSSATIPLQTYPPSPTLSSRATFLAAKANYISSCNAESQSPSSSPKLRSYKYPPSPSQSLSPSRFQTESPADLVPRSTFHYPTQEQTPAQAIAQANRELDLRQQQQQHLNMSRRSPSPTPSMATAISATTAIGKPKSTSGQISSIILPSILVPYIWPTSPASFFSGVIVGLLLACLRPLIEHYVDVGASYIAVGMRFTLIWGSVALIAWAVLRILQHTSAATLIIKPSDGEEVPAPEFASHGRANSIQEDFGDYSLHRRSSGSTHAGYGNASSAASIYSSATSSSGHSSSTNASPMYYSPPPPQYNPYNRSSSPTHSTSPNRVSVPSHHGSYSSTSPTLHHQPGSPGKPLVRRLEPRIVPVDEPSVQIAGKDHDAYKVYGGGNQYSRRTPDTVLEKPAGQNAFRIRRGI